MKQARAKKHFSYQKQQEIYLKIRQKHRFDSFLLLSRVLAYLSKYVL